MKKILSVLLTFLLLFSLFPAAFASYSSMGFVMSLTSKGESSVSMEQGDEITVNLTLSRTDADASWQMQYWQDEVEYDSDAFEFVSCAPTEGVVWSQKKSGSKGYVVFSAVSFKSGGDAYPSELGCSFVLKVKADSGTYAIKNTDYKVSPSGMDDLPPCEGRSLQITVKDSPARFKDVSRSAWYYDAVESACEKGLFDGTGNGCFSPSGPMTRASVLTVLWNLEGKPEPEGSGYFSDVSKSAWYAKAASWAYEAGVTSGYGNEKLGPNDYVTREQIAVMLINYAMLRDYEISEPADLSAFNDYASVSSWALENLAVACADGLISGRSGNKLSPRETASRAEAAQIFVNFINCYLSD